MTREDIIRMAREAGLTERNRHSEIIVRHSNGSWVDVEQVLTRFARLVSAAEREAAEKEREDCAKLLDEMKECAEELMEHPDYSGSFEYERMLALEDAAEAIRNRSKEVK